MPSSPSPTSSLKAGGLTIAAVTLVFVHTLQLQRLAPATSRSTSKRTAPQWQLPTCLDWLILDSLLACSLAASQYRRSALRAIQICRRLFTGYRAGQP